MLRGGTLGAGEAYLEGWWDCDQLDVMFCKALHAHLEDKVRRNPPNALIVASQLLFNPAKRSQGPNGRGTALQYGQCHVRAYARAYDEFTVAGIGRMPRRWTRRSATRWI